MRGHDGLQYLFKGEKDKGGGGEADCRCHKGEEVAHAEAEDAGEKRKEGGEDAEIGACLEGDKQEFAGRRCGGGIQSLDDRRDFGVEVLCLLRLFRLRFDDGYFQFVWV